MIEKKQLDKHVHLAGIWENVWNVYPALDILVNNSRSEGMPLTLLEGMACGLPVVAGRVGGIREIIEDGASGLLVGQGDIPGLAERVVKLLDDPPRRKQMGQVGRQRVERYYNLRTSTRQMADLFRQLVRRNSQNHSYLSSDFSDVRSRR